MADAMDLVQQRVEEERQRHIRAARAKTPGVSRVLCIECEAPIPPARRRAIPGVQLCITCQEIAELKMPDLNAGSVEAAMSMIAGTARSMGITVEE